MVKVTRPLFADSAKGNLGNIGAFRRGQTGPQFIPLTVPTDRKTAKQLRLRACFSVAKKAHAAIPSGSRPRWGIYWRQYLQEHPGCRP
ncbi:hypothetical protein [Methylobacter psychrophilus]|uniref:hypothetical protein n=1 Tax=Methylobacter psychrophilus TaxID=96941 RepID=UPI0021D5123C|nr:hypothetical protein [Methylobacter psychrophilus]